MGWGGGEVVCVREVPRVCGMGERESMMDGEVERNKG